MKLLAATVLAIGLGAASAQAMPVSSLGDSIAPAVQTVGWRCGPGWHINPWGRCVPSRRFYGGPRFYGGYGWGHRGWHHRRWHHRHW
jgi:hypothetical protein